MPHLIGQLPVALLDILSNSLILYQIAPLLPVHSLLSLAATSKDLRALLLESPGAFRYLNLSGTKSAILPYQPIDNGGINWRSQRMDEALTEDEFYSGPLRGIFSYFARKDLLKNVQTLILDGLSVPADMIQEIISEDRFNVRVLSVRGARHLNERKLMQVLRYAVRPTRPAGSPRLKALYYFRPYETTSPIKAATTRRALRNVSSQASTGVTTSEGAQIGAEWNERSQQSLNESLLSGEDDWYKPVGRVLKRAPVREWAETLKACEGIIAFDAVLCRGPRHDVENIAEDEESCGYAWLPPAVATIALGPTGCAKCNSSWEKPGIFGQSPPQHLPLLSPPPLHSSSVRQAQVPFTLQGISKPPLYVRCEGCLLQRWCERCHRWWDEQCYPTHLTGKRFEEVRDDQQTSASFPVQPRDSVKVQYGLCTEHCLVGEMMSGAGSNGMWG